MSAYNKPPANLEYPSRSSPTPPLPPPPQTADASQDEKKWLRPLGGHRYVGVSKRGGMVCIDIRELFYIHRQNIMLPGKKGIGLSIEQFRHLLALAGDIEAETSRLLRRAAGPERRESGDGQDDPDTSTTGKNRRDDSSGSSDRVLKKARLA